METSSRWQSRAMRAEEKGMSMVVERIPELELARDMVERARVHQGTRGQRAGAIPVLF